MGNLRGIELMRRGGTLADELIIGRSSLLGFSACSVTFPASSCDSLGATEPPQAEAEHDEGCDDAEAGRGKWRGAEERHGKRVLDGGCSRKRRHGEGDGAKSNRRGHQPARYIGGPKPRVSQGSEHKDP